MCTKTELQTALEKFGTHQNIYMEIRIDKIILYGSYARGDNTDVSAISFQQMHCYFG